MCVGVGVDRHDRRTVVGLLLFVCLCMYTILSVCVQADVLHVNYSEKNPDSFSISRQQLPSSSTAELPTGHTNTSLTAHPFASIETRHVP